MQERAKIVCNYDNILYRQRGDRLQITAFLIINESQAIVVILFQPVFSNMFVKDISYSPCLQ